MRTKRVEDLPEEVTTLADGLSKMLSGTAPVVRLPNHSGWSDSDGEPPDDVDEWTAKDFVRWFAGQCRKRLDMPFSPLYARDCPMMKTLLADVKGIGRGKYELRDFLDWTFDHRDRIVREKDSFTLNSIRYFLNDFLQASRDEHEEQPQRPRRDLMAEMTEERRTGLAHMLQRYGIPLVVAYAMAAYGETADFDKIVRNVGRVLDEAVGKGELEFVRFVARSSQDGSPYPRHFPLRDWRSRWSEVWNVAKCQIQPWWRDDDHEGRPLIEYDDLSIGESAAETETGGQ